MLPKSEFNDRARMEWKIPNLLSKTDNLPQQWQVYLFPTNGGSAITAPILVVQAATSGRTDGHCHGGFQNNMPYDST